MVWYGTVKFIQTEDCTYVRRYCTTYLIIDR